MEIAKLETDKQEKDRIEKEKTELFLKKFDTFKTVDLNTFVYLRVSTDKQTLSGQLKEVFDYCENNRVYPPSKNIYYDYAVSGKIDWTKRKLNDLVGKIKKGGLMIIPELSRLGRNMGQINGLVEDLVNNHGITIIDIKNNLKMDGSLQSKILSTIMNISAELEREITRERIKKGMDTDEAKLKMKNRKRKTKNKLDQYKDDIQNKITAGMNPNQIAKELGVNKSQVYTFARKHKFIK